MSRVCGCLGVEKRGGNLSFGSFPAFSSFCVGRVAGLEPAAFALGGVMLWPGELRPQVCVPRLSVALLFVCAWLSLGVGRVAGFEPAAFALGGVVLCLSEFLSRVGPPRFACGFCLPGRVGVGALYLFISPTSVCVVRVFRQRHVAVISSHSFSSLSVVVRCKRSARLLAACWGAWRCRGCCG